MFTVEPQGSGMGEGRIKSEEPVLEFDQLMGTVTNAQKPHISHLGYI